MESEEMENIQDYLPLFADNIKQELFDPSEKANNLCDSNEEKVRFSKFKPKVGFYII
jgi:hypothetical protein